MRCFHYRPLRLALGVAAAAGLLSGCGWHHHPHARKVKSYDRAISDDGQDPTYQEDPERADVEVREVR